MNRARRWTFTAIVAGTSILASCAAAPRALPWDVQISDATLRARVRGVVATVHAGSCTGASVWSLAYRPSAPPTAMPPELGPGDYGFEIVALDATCAQIARGCAMTTLPLASGARLTVSLSASSGAASCPTSCSDGLCGGASDAGPRPDAASDAFTAPDAFMGCATGTLDCNFDRSDGCETSITTLTDCGGCRVACARPHATATCGAAGCAIGSCNATYDDCNHVDSDGCETSLETTHDCHACGASCNLPHAVARCGATACEIASCHAGWADCDGSAATGCEASLASASSCGACTTSCSGATPLCGVDAGGNRACVAACAAPAATACGTSCVDTTSTVSACGGCGNACSAPHAELSCSASACTRTACDVGWADCNADPADGCERATTTATDCGSCGTACASPTADTTCASGTCTVVTCAPGRLDCDASGTNGCEADATAATSCGACGTTCSGATPLCSGGATPTCVATCPAPLMACGGRCVDVQTDVDHCGSCTACPTVAGSTSYCAAGICRVQTCAAGTADCNGLASDGCEVTLATDAAHCGTCANACSAGPHATATCSGGTCALRCDPLRGDCDGMTSTGCETTLTTTTDCGSCGAPCAPASAIGDCSTGVCAIGSCMPNRGDCDGQVSTGCETDLLTNRHDCGMCGHMCTGGTSCCNGNCQSTCP